MPGLLHIKRHVNDRVERRMERFESRMGHFKERVNDMRNDVNAEFKTEVKTGPAPGGPNDEVHNG